MTLELLIKTADDLDELQAEYDDLASAMSDLVQQTVAIRQRMRQVKQNIAGITQSRDLRYVGQPEAQAEMDRRLEKERAEWAELVSSQREVDGFMAAIRSRMNTLTERIASLSLGPDIGDKSEHKSWVDLLIHLGQIAVLGTGWTAAGRTLVLLTRSMYERALDIFLNEEARIEENLARLRDEQAALEKRLAEIQEARNQLEDQFEATGVEDEYAEQDPKNPFGYGKSDEDAADELAPQGAYRLYR